MNLLKKLKQRKSALYASLFAVICVGTPHIVPVVAQFSKFQSSWFSISHAIAYALALEIGIVFFALRSKMIQTIIFAIIATTLYLGYYDQYIPWWTISPFMPIDISISLPIMIVLIAHETSKKQNKHVSKPFEHFKETTESKGMSDEAIKLLNADDLLTDNTDEDKVTLEVGRYSPLKENGTKEHVSKHRNPKPLPDHIKKQIIELIEEGKTYRDIADITNTSLATISRVANEETNGTEEIIFHKQDPKKGRIIQ